MLALRHARALRAMLAFRALRTLSGSGRARELRRAAVELELVLGDAAGRARGARARGPLPHQPSDRERHVSRSGSGSGSGAEPCRARVRSLLPQATQTS